MLVEYGDKQGRHVHWNSCIHYPWSQARISKELSKQPWQQNVNRFFPFRASFHFFPLCFRQIKLPRCFMKVSPGFSVATQCQGHLQTVYVFRYFSHKQIIESQSNLKWKAPTIYKRQTFRTGTRTLQTQYPIRKLLHLPYLVLCHFLLRFLITFCCV